MKINVTHSSMPTLDEYIKEIKPIFESRWLTNMGEKHNLLKEQLETYLQTEHVSLFCNGHLALEQALQAMGLTGEVITTPFTFISTTHAIVRNGLTPVFCDINPKDYTLDVTKLESLITEKTSAIVPVHVYGNVCHVNEIERIAGKYKLKVIYDAAHAFGETYKGKGVATFGDASMFSFHATKVFHTIEGGAVCYTDRRFGKRLETIRNFGLQGQEEIVEVGANGKMNEFSAAMGLCNLRHIDEEIAKRKLVVQRYKARLGGIKGITLCEEQAGVKSNYAYFPVVFKKEAFGKSRDEVIALLAQEGIFARKYFYPLTSNAACYKGKLKTAETPVAKEIAENILTLPLYADLTVEQVDRICNLITG